MSIECFSLTKRYGNRTVLNDISLEIPKGKVTGLVGPNGAGKSTLLKMITGLVYPTGGFVRIDGFDVHTRQFSQNRDAMHPGFSIISAPNTVQRKDLRSTVLSAEAGSG